MIEIQNLTFTYDTGDSAQHPGIKDINLSIERGTCVLLCGQSGCGKSTILKSLNGLIPHFHGGDKSGCVLIDGLNVDDTPMFCLSQKVASVFQNPKSQFFNVDAESEVTFSLENQGIAVEAIDNLLGETIRDLGLEKLINKSVFHMSGGEKQIVAFAAAYISTAEIVVLDEPSANLDADSIGVIRGILQKMKQNGKTIIIAEHRLSYLAGLVDSAYYISDGCITQVLDGAELFVLADTQRKALGLRGLHVDNTLDLANCVITPNAIKKNQLIVENLHLAYGKNLVCDSVSFSADSGEIIGITGKNGAGKSTLSRCLCGLHKQKSGTITWNGQKLNMRQRRHMSYIVMQDVNHQLFADSVLNECMMGIDDVNTLDATAILKELELHEQSEAHPQSLSGGQKQRLAIAVSVVANKRLVIFDEPTSGLDYKSMLQVSGLIRKIAESGTIVLIVTHDVELIQSACTRCILIGGSEI